PEQVAVPVAAAAPAAVTGPAASTPPTTAPVNTRQDKLRRYPLMTHSSPSAPGTSPNGPRTVTEHAGPAHHPPRRAAEAAAAAGEKQRDKGGQRPQSRRMDTRTQCLCIDPPAPARLAAFWQAALGWRRTAGDEDEVVLEPPEGSPEDGVAPDLLFLRVPEKKAVKNRVHLDLRPADQAAEVARLDGLGARPADRGEGTEASWVVLADPDGNEFCVLRALKPGDQTYEGVQAQSAPGGAAPG